MMEINRKALYNSLRMNWELNPSVAVEPWQVEDYRSLPLNTLLEMLKTHHILLDKDSFLAFADIAETPEELLETLFSDSTPTAKAQDQVYLVIFELWRRLLPEKPCLSIFCDELDYQIYLYDTNKAKTSESIEDVLANLKVLLEENSDLDNDPQGSFNYINNACANDLECFLFDFITEQIDNKNYPYATELLEDFISHIHDVKWFELLQVRILISTDPEEADEIIKELLETTEEEKDLEFNLEILTFFVSNGDEKTFLSIVRKTLPLIQLEEDFQSLISICIDFYQRLDKEKIEKELQKILNHRIGCNLASPFDPKNPQLVEFFKIINC